MPNVNIKFKLPEEAEDYKHAFMGSRYHNVLWELDQQLRNKIKYGTQSDEETEIYQTIRNKLHALLDDEGLVL